MLALFDDVKTLILIHSWSFNIITRRRID
jgi:hypothetical protein